MKVYLNLCCFSRPYDDQSQIRRSLEKSDYTEWQHQRFDNVSSDEFNKATVAYSKEKPFQKKTK